MDADRSLDVVVYGATGFVGRLTAEYLAEHAPPEARIALGGRSRERLEEVRSSLGAAAADWPLVVADSSDEAAIAELAASAKVVATTVGPYRKYGMPLLEACARAGTHYADLCGEVLFMHEAAERFHAVAEGSGARIVHGCGFDSIPSDLGVLLCHQAAQEHGLGELGETTMVVAAMRGGASGGTLASMKGQIDEMRADEQARRTVEDPYALSPDRAAEPDHGDERDLRGVEQHERLGTLGPFVMASINTRVVRRSNALQSWAYGRSFRYREVTRTGEGPLGMAKGAALAGGVGALTAGLGFGPTRAVLDKVLPSPGEGPSEEARRKGFFKIEVHAETSGGRRVEGRIVAQGDPGYQATAVMLGESALCLALDQDRLPPRAGVLTPATAMGDVLVERLRAAGQTLEARPVD